VKEKCYRTFEGVQLFVTPIFFAEAAEFVKLHHRHHKPPRSHVFSIGLSTKDGKVCAVAIVGRPVGRGNQDGYTLEITRLCSDGTPNCCSALYAAARKAAFALGYRRLITYTLPEEGGSSCVAAGFKLVGERGGGSWSCPSRPRVDLAPTQTKLLWEFSK
jgi:hypothetical protein